MNNIHSILSWLDSILWGNCRENEKRYLLLNLLILRQIAFGFEQNNKEDENVYTAEEVSDTPLYANWKRITDGDVKSVKHYLYKTLSAAVNDFPDIQGVLSPDAVMIDIDDRQLSAIVDVFSKLPCVDMRGKSSDFEKAYEYLVNKYPLETGNTPSHDFYTPKQLARLLVSILHPDRGSVYDPCCNSAGMLVQAGEYLREKNAVFSLYGQEANQEAWDMAKMNLYMHGLYADLSDKAADALLNDRHNGLRADYALGNPPFGGSDWGKDSLSSDPRWKYGIPPKNRGGLVWLQHMLFHLNEQGKMGVILSSAVLDSLIKSEINIRTGLARDDLVEAVIALPAGMFLSDASVSLWVLNKKKKPVCRNRVLFVDAGAFGVKNEKAFEFSEHEMQSILKAYREYRLGSRAERKGFCVTAATDEIASNGFSFAPNKYVTHEKLEPLSTRDLHKQEQELMNDLRRLMSENSHALSDIINGL